MRHCGQKLIFQTIRFFSGGPGAALLLKQSDVLDRHCHKIRGHSHGCHVLFPISRFLVTLDFNRADNSSLVEVLLIVQILVGIDDELDGELIWARVVKLLQKR